jgi:hypothetical protein
MLTIEYKLTGIVTDGLKEIDSAHFFDNIKDMENLQMQEFMLFNYKVDRGVFLKSGNITGDSICIVRSPADAAALINVNLKEV